MLDRKIRKLAEEELKQELISVFGPFVAAVRDKFFADNRGLGNTLEFIDFVFKRSRTSSVNAIASLILDLPVDAKNISNDMRGFNEYEKILESRVEKKEDELLKQNKEE